MEKNRQSILEKIRRHKNRILYGGLIVGASFGGAEIAKLAKYEMSAVKILFNEGGYASKDKIDQETKFGVTEPTLTSFKKKHPEDAKDYPEAVKDLSVIQANRIIRIAFYEHYKINEINNQSLANMVLDAVYNHEYETFRGFVKEGLIAVKRMRHEDIETRPRNWRDVPEFLNQCSKSEQKTFYDSMVQARIDFINRNGYIKKYKGLKRRVMNFAGKFEAYIPPQKTSPEQRALAYLDKYATEKNPTYQASRFVNGYHKASNKPDISWEMALKGLGNQRT